MDTLGCPLCCTLDLAGEWEARKDRWKGRVPAAGKGLCVLEEVVGPCAMGDTHISIPAVSPLCP